MNEDSNIETVKRTYAAFGSGNVDAFLKELTEDIAFEIPKLDGFPLDSRYDGHNGMLKFLADRVGAVEYKSFQAHEFLAKGDVVVVIGETEGEAVPTRKPFHHDWVQIFRFRDGKIAELREFVSCDEIRMAFQ